MAEADRRVTIVLAGMVAFAFLVRLAVRLWAGEASFSQGGYSFYRVIAERFVRGEGLCFGPDDCALRPPVYPLLLAPFVAAGWLYPGMVVFQAAAGAALAAIAYALGRDLFGRTPGLVAAAMTALSPYALVHDTALQETVVINLLVAGGTWLVLRSAHSGSAVLALGSGAAFGLAALTTARALAFAAWAVVWTLAAPGQSRAVRVRRALLLALPILLLVGGWMLRNARVVGAPVLTTETGASLWIANNEWTFLYFPERSIDLAARHSFDQLRETHREAFDRVAADPVAFDRFLAGLAVDYVRAHPVDVMRGAVRKLGVVVTAEFSPGRGRAVGLGYQAIFLGVNVLAAIGIWRAHRQGSDHRLLAGMLVAFLGTTAVFWSHTSHKSVIDLFLFVYCGAAIAKGRVNAGPWRNGKSEGRASARPDA